MGLLKRCAASHHACLPLLVASRPQAYSPTVLLLRAYYISMAGGTRATVDVPISTLV